MTWLIPISVVVVVLYWLLAPLWQGKKKRRTRIELDEYEEQTYYHKY